MINPQYYTIQAFLDALQGLTYEGNPINPYSIPPQGELGNYIVVTAPTANEDGCKSIIGHLASINVEVIHQTPGNVTSPLQAQDITSLVMATLKPNPGDTITIPNFNMATLMLSNVVDGSELFPSNRSYRNILTYEFIIYEIVDQVWILDTGFWNDIGTWIDTATWID
jgi:hypothetical protein